MTKLTIRYFYGQGESRSLYTLTIERNSDFLSTAFKEIIESVVYLQIAGCDILDANILIYTPTC
jgi:hypothetical protein